MRSSILRIVVAFTCSLIILGTSPRIFAQSPSAEDSVRSFVAALDSQQ
jgi:hypothetical protein